MAKHHLVELIATKRDETPPPNPTLYKGQLGNVPLTVSTLAKLSVSKLRAILHYHGFMPIGTKDELILSVLALRKGETAKQNFNQGSTN